LITLPRGACAIDFAYAVHTEVGDTCVGAKINGRHMPLATKLKNGESVEIIRSPKQGPSAIWEQVVVTGKARASIRRYLKNAEKIEHQRMGRAILEKAFRDAGQEYSEKALTTALKKLKLARVDDVYAHLGQGLVAAGDVVKAVFPSIKADAGLLSWANWMTRKPKGSAIPIEGLAAGLGYHLAPCCQPLAGDRIIGVISQGLGVVVHTADCDQLEALQDQIDSWLDLKWSPDAANEVQVGRLKIVIDNAKGALANMCNAIANHGGNINNLKIVGRTALVFDILVDVEVRDAKHLAAIIAGLRTSPSINAVDRPHGEKELTQHDA
jgi:GTP pyrophosphokinase